MSRAAVNLEKFYLSLDDLSFDFRNKNLYSLILKKVSGEKALDIGCGSGHLVNLMTESGINAYGIEPDANLIELSKTFYGEDIKIEKKSAEDLSKVKGKFHSITVIDVLEHLEDDSVILKKIKSKLYDNGTVIIVVPAYSFLLGKRDRALGHFRRYSKKQLVKLIEANGFKIKQIRYWNAFGFLPYLISEKIFKRALKAEIRTKRHKNILDLLISRLLFFWFKYLENNVNFGFGLSLICVAEPNINYKNSLN